ncbi:MAG: protein TolQ [Betaproteobacteria bacterium TMED41]|nr:MAG: protein TolQ [Betaproteobacteria bacterium TMED41]|tara:strand:- start:687 stop:1355 length:669 start_codon:yes stop_codon:yes gene_type:complete
MLTTELSLLALVLNASLPVQGVIGILILVSIISWTVIFSKLKFLFSTKRSTDKFEEEFWSGGELMQLMKKIEEKKITGSLPRIFEAGMHEFLKSRKQNSTGQSEIIDNTRRAMKAATNRELSDLENWLPFLATTGSVSPYVGLFGTVWGIMHAFLALANIQQATLANVAPGIAEALIATAIGLLAAIPAVIAYNKFSTEIDILASRFDGFMEEFSNILQRQI